MEQWKKISAMLCVFGVLKEFRPGEPYVTKYLTNPPVNLTLEVVSDYVYPVSIYTTMASLIIIFLITDLLRYKPVIIFNGLCAMMAYMLLIIARSLFWIQVVEVIYGLFMAAEIAYYTYIYAKVDKSHYQEVSGHTRAAYLFGRSVSGMAAQVYVYFASSYFNLNIFTLVGVTFATVWAFFLPPVATSIYFSHADTEEELVEFDKNRTNYKSKCMKSIQYLKNDFYAAISNLYILKWMIWWSLATCGYYQVLSFVQVLWEQIIYDSNTYVNSEWNGAVETIYTLLSAAASFGCGLLSVNWKRYGESVLCLCSLLIAVLLFLMSQTNQILMAYIFYILQTILYNGMITIANSEIAKYLNPDSHGLIFGFTLFMSLVFQSILILSVAALGERLKFVVYSCYNGILGFTFGIIMVMKVVKNVSREKKDEEKVNSSL